MNPTCAKPDSAASEARLLRQLVDGHADGLFAFDRDLRLTAWNHAMARIVERSAEAVLGRALLDAVPEEIVELGALQRVREGTSEVAYARPCSLGAAKRAAWIEVRLGLLLDEAGAFDGGFAVVREVTERRALDHERQRHIERLRAALRARDELVSIASHELRTPLTTLRLQADRLERLAERLAPSDPQSIRRLARSWSDQVARLARLLDDLLDLSRLRVGQLDVQPLEADLGEIARGVLERFSDELSAAGYQVELDLEGQVVGHWDPLRLEQVVINLVSNAIKYGAGRPITVSLRSDGAQARLTVRDRGRGIAQVDQERIFECFQRAARPGEASGLGLGLYVVKEIVGLHGGRVTVRSEPGEGAEFTVELPL